MKLVFKITLAAISLALNFTAVNQQQADAATIKYAFNVNSSILSGTGSFNFDDSSFTNEPIPIATVQLLNFVFNNDPQTLYTQEDDIDYPTLVPVVFPTVAGNSSIGLSYLFNNKTDPASSYEIAGYDFIVSNQTFNNAVSYTPIPESATLVGTLTVCSIAWLTSRKAKSAKKAA
ncbi:PEP-CTERM sorting domain-containing protein [Nostoc sphaeroides]|uniref:PEP-CTERM sorting domain-containing protein n=1 Tax=Nostoc sphaeroides CCNUC1 TaxID=2653204 RepID=A0A5P8WBX4_9NOSO|nr:PEP-CTERM sorting domain-containing protein [Nostoc sphaeroides]MCC5632333.1 PEP-CTERM sorting domain-containing protein [Nostoc sphaeroides CHAB 2801]QFS50323.1 PEP-CTERM sorting domain-containing protein [Nostoc sphaeroides CCNUC1]